MCPGKARGSRRDPVSAAARPRKAASCAGLARVLACGRTRMPVWTTRKSEPQGPSSCASPPNRLRAVGRWRMLVRARCRWLGRCCLAVFVLWLLSSPALADSLRLVLEVDDEDAAGAPFPPDAGVQLELRRRRGRRARLEEGTPRVSGRCEPELRARRQRHAARARPRSRDRRAARAALERAQHRLGDAAAARARRRRCERARGRCGGRPPVRAGSEARAHPARRRLRARRAPPGERDRAARERAGALRSRLRHPRARICSRSRPPAASCSSSRPTAACWP